MYSCQIFLETFFFYGLNCFQPNKVSKSIGYLLTHISSSLDGSAIIGLGSPECFQDWNWIEYKRHAYIQGTDNCCSEIFIQKKKTTFLSL